jgi:hypothetical protein
MQMHQPSKLSVILLIAHTVLLWCVIFALGIVFWIKDGFVSGISFLIGPVFILGLIVFVYLRSRRQPTN